MAKKLSDVAILNEKVKMVALKLYSLGATCLAIALGIQLYYGGVV